MKETMYEIIVDDSPFGCIYNQEDLAWVVGLLSKCASENGRTKIEISRVEVK